MQLVKQPPPGWRGARTEAGALLSVGLLQQLDYDSFDACVRDVSAAGLALSLHWCCYIGCETMYVCCCHALPPDREWYVNTSI
jgi:hypothetical protein